MDFWRRRHDPGILFLFFDELFRDDDAQVRPELKINQLFSLRALSAVDGFR